MSICGGRALPIRSLAVSAVLLRVATVCVAADDTTGTAGGKRMVARDDYEVTSRFLAPKRLGRHFWNMLSVSPSKAMEKHVPTEAMVRDAARCYWVPDLATDGWWVYLIKNRGVTKYTTMPEELDAARTSQVTVDLRAIRPKIVRELR